MMNKRKNNFSDRLKRARLQRKLSQNDLHYRSGVAISAICHYERGYRVPKYSSIYIALSKALEVSVDYLLGLTDAMDFRPRDDSIFGDVCRLSAEQIDLLFVMIRAMAEQNAPAKRVYELPGTRERVA